MCGICGIITFDKAPVSKQQLKLMTNALAHRGPDGEGFWLSNIANIGFGHRRLSIIDLSQSGNQPMQYADGRFTITFNGEIYNYIELKSKLIQHGYQFKSDSDTEVLLALYHQKGAQCLNDLEGMFAFAIWDEEKQILFCARDRFGEKPLYIFKDDKQLVFASEIKALFAIGVKRQINQNKLFNFISLKHTYEPYNRSSTFYNGIEKLEAAHYIIINSSGNTTKVKYWDIDVNNQSDIPFEDACKTFRQLFNDSLLRRLRSDVPIGSSLSGGLDSSLIVCLIDSINNGHLQQSTFSARFKNFEKDEGYFMQQVIEKTNVDPHFVFPDEDTFLDSFERMTYHMEEPFGTASVMAQYAVMELAKKNQVTVLLDGQGADESLAGYNYMYYYFFLDQARHNRSNLKAELKAYHKLFNTEFVTGKLFNLYACAPTLYNKSIRYKQKREAAANDFIHKDFEKTYGKIHFEYNQGIANSFNHNLYYSISSGQLEELLMYADRNSMAHSLEVRLPFLDHNLVEFVFSLPPHFKIQKAWTKYIMRKSFEDILPPSICWRKDKIGYITPDFMWLQNPKIQDKIQSDISILVDNKIVNAPLVDAVKTTNAKFKADTTDIFRCWVAAQLLKTDRW